MSAFSLGQVVGAGFFPAYLNGVGAGIGSLQLLAEPPRAEECFIFTDLDFVAFPSGAGDPVDFEVRELDGIAIYAERDHGTGPTSYHWSGFQVVTQDHLLYLDNNIGGNCVVTCRVSGWVGPRADIYAP